MNLEDLKNIIVLIAIIAILGAATAIALTDFKTDVNRGSGNTINESITTTNDTEIVTLAHDEITVSAVANETTSLTIDTEYHVNDSTAGKVFINLSGKYNVTYSYLLDPAAMNITDNGLRGVDNATEYLDTTGTIAGIAVLIGIVVLAFTFMRR